MTPPPTDNINFPHLLLTAILTLAVIWGILAIFPFPSDSPHGMVPKILTGDLPDCATTIGSDTGYYCQINNVSQYCRVEKGVVDSLVTKEPHCSPVMLV